VNSGSSDCGLTHDLDTFPLKVIRPFVAARMEEFRGLFCVRIDAREVRTFVKIAIHAGERQVVEFVESTMNAGNDMLDVLRSQRGIVLVEVAVFAAVNCPSSNGGPRYRVH
jgi:hypothetical protein